MVILDEGDEYRSRCTLVWLKSGGTYGPWQDQPVVQMHPCGVEAPSAVTTTAVSKFRTYPRGVEGSTAMTTSGPSTCSRCTRVGLKLLDDGLAVAVVVGGSRYTLVGLNRVAHAGLPMARLRSRRTFMGLKRLHGRQARSTYRTSQTNLRWVKVTNPLARPTRTATVPDAPS